MINILHIETASPTCSVAISEDDQLLAIRESHVDKSHASLITVFIQELFEETGLKAFDLDAVSVSMGPGSYTGLRIGVSTAKRTGIWNRETPDRCKYTKSNGLGSDP